MHLSNVIKQNKLLTVYFILFCLFFTGCTNDFTFFSPNPTITPDISIVKPTSSSITIADGEAVTKDCTPPLTIFSEGATLMSFSGDGIIWTDWVEYNIFYDKFNIANGLNGTTFGSGTKYVYVRFKNEENNLSSSNDFVFDTIEYEMSELYSIKIFPQEVTIPVEGTCLLTLYGYDYGAENEVPLENTKVIWSKPCSVGTLTPTIGLSTTYTAPSIPGKRNITAQYDNLQTGAMVIVVDNN